MLERLCYANDMENKNDKKKKDINEIKRGERRQPKKPVVIWNLDRFRPFRLKDLR